MNAPYNVQIVDDFFNSVLAQSNANTGSSTLSFKLANDGTGTSYSQFSIYSLSSVVQSDEEFCVSISSTSKLKHYNEFGVSTTSCCTFTSSQTNITLLSNIILTQQVPKIKLIDFLSGLFKTFNLTAYVREELPTGDETIVDTTA